MSLFLLMLMLGVANWFATTLLVESELFRPVRDWVAYRYDEATGSRSAAVWSKLHYLVSCHMCAGTWVALAMALFVNPVVAGGFFGYVLTALVIKGIGHLVLLLNNVGNARIEYDRAQAAESAMNMLPDLGGLLAGLERVEGLKARNDNGRRDGTMFGDMGRMPSKKDGPKFEPFNEGEPESAWNKAETSFKG